MSIMYCVRCGQIALYNYVNRQRDTDDDLPFVQGQDLAPPVNGAPEKSLTVDTHTRDGDGNSDGDDDSS